MRIIIAAIGRLKSGPDQMLFDRYAKRFDAAGRGAGLGPIELMEFLESRAADRRERQCDETGRLLKAVSQAQHIFVLTERGRELTSERFAERLARLRDDGCGTTGFLIGGPDGHDPNLNASANCEFLSLGRMTFPHGLARVILAEQLYRAVTIAIGHPYHRGGHE